MEQATHRAVDAHTLATYYLYNELFSPDLPSSRFDALMRRPGEGDKVAMIAAMAHIERDEVSLLLPDARQALEKKLGGGLKYISEGGDVIQTAVFDMAPISESGLVVRRTIASIHLPDDFPVQDRVALDNKIKPELAEQFASLARRANAEGRWLMCIQKAEGSGVPTGAAAQQLGFMDAGSLDVLILRSARPIAKGVAPA